MAKSNKSKRRQLAFILHGLNIWFRNYYVAYAFVVCNDYHSVCLCDMFEIYDNNISITHIEDFFTSTGTQLVEVSTVWTYPTASCWCN